MNTQNISIYCHSSTIQFVTIQIDNFCIVLTPILKNYELHKNEQ